MRNLSTSVGLDVHARSIKAVALVLDTGEVKVASFGYDPASVAGWVMALPQPAKCVYESGCTGFHLARALGELGVECAVGAVSKMTKPTALRKAKSDVSDAEWLARQLPLGNITEVWVPDEECEGARDLARALGDAREETTRSKHLLTSFLLRHGLCFDERTPTGARRKNWTAAFWAWVRSVELPD